MKTIQIKIGNSQLNFNTISEATEYLNAIDEIKANKSNRQRTLDAIQELKNMNKSELKARSMTKDQLKEFLFNE